MRIEAGPTGVFLHSHRFKWIQIYADPYVMNQFSIAKLHIMWQRGKGLRMSYDNGNMRISIENQSKILGRAKVRIWSGNRISVQKQNEKESPLSGRKWEIAFESEQATGNPIADNFL